MIEALHMTFCDVAKAAPIVLGPLENTTLTPGTVLTPGTMAEELNLDLLGSSG